MVNERNMNPRPSQFNPPTMSEIEIEFEGRSLELWDLPGVIMALERSFRGSDDINIQELAGFILEQVYTQPCTVGSVLTFKDHDELEPEFVDAMLGFATILRLKETRVSTMLVRHISNLAATDGRRELSSLLSSPDSNVGLIISERIMGFPPHIATPIYHDLGRDVIKAQNKNLPFNFTHYAIISKVMVPSDPQMALMMGSMGDTYLNQEEELIGPECDFMVKTNMSRNQGDLTETKRIMVFKAEKLDTIVNIFREKLG